MLRGPGERAIFHVEDTVIRFAGHKMGFVRAGAEQYQSYSVAVERYEEMKVIAAVDYGFHMFMENIDEE